MSTLDVASDDPPVQQPVPGKSAAPESHGLSGRALRGSAWTIGGQAAGQLIRFANNLALTHLVAPELLGLMGTVHVFLAGLHLMSDFGVGPAIIQNERGDEPPFYDTAWTMHVVRGSVIWLLTLPLGPLLSLAYADQPGAEHLAWLVPTVGVTALISGLHSTALYRLNRHLRLRPMVLVDVGSQLAGCTTGLLWAYMAPSLWALVAAVLVYQTVHTASSHCLGTRNRLRWDRDAARSVARFGRWIWLSTMLTWAAAQADRVVMPALLGFDGFAVYQVALFIAVAVPEAAHMLGSRIVFPALSDLARRGDPGLNGKLLRARLVMVLPSVAVLLVLSLFGHVVIRSLYPERFHEGGWILRLLAAAAVPQVLTASSWYAFFAMGHSFAPMCMQAAKLVLKCITMAVGYQLGGMPGVILGLVAAEVLHYPLVALALRRHGVFQPQLDIPVLLGSAGIVVAGLWAW